MDREQEDMQFLGILGCYKQSFKIISSWRKIFSQITLTLILPLSFIFLFEIQASNFLSKKIKHTGAQEAPPSIIEILEDSDTSKLFDMITPEFITLLLFKFAYYIGFGKSPWKVSWRARAFDIIAFEKFQKLTHSLQAL